MGTLDAAKGIVLCRVKAVDADAHRTGASVLEPLRHLFGDEGAVAAEHGTKSLRGGVGHQFVDIVAHECFSTAENHDFEASACDLLDHLLALGRRQLPAVAFGRVLIAMFAPKVAPVGCHPRYDHRHPFLQMGRMIGGDATSWASS